MLSVYNTIVCNPQLSPSLASRESLIPPLSNSRFLPLRLLLGSCLHLWLLAALVLAKKQHMPCLLLHALDVSPSRLPLHLRELGDRDIRLHSLSFHLQRVLEGHLG